MGNPNNVAALFVSKIAVEPMVKASLIYHLGQIASIEDLFENKTMLELKRIDKTEHTDIRLKALDFEGDQIINVDVKMHTPKYMSIRPKSYEYYCEHPEQYIASIFESNGKFYTYMFSFKDLKHILKPSKYEGYYLHIDEFLDLINGDYTSDFTGVYPISFMDNPDYFSYDTCLGVPMKDLVTYFTIIFNKYNELWGCNPSYRDEKYFSFIKFCLDTYKAFVNNYNDEQKISFMNIFPIPEDID